MDAVRALFATDAFAGPSDLETVALRLLLAFVLGQLLAWVYQWTHGGLSYSRSFVQSLVILTMIVAVVMIVIANNIVTAFGLLGAMALIRFRNVLKDTRDTVFIFGAIVIGMAVGSGRYGESILACGAFSIVILYMHWSRFGSRSIHDGFLRLRLAAGEDNKIRLSAILRRHCRSMTLVSVHRSAGDDQSEYAYQISLRDRSRDAELLEELQSQEGVSDLSLALHEELQEV